MLANCIYICMNEVLSVTMRRQVFGGNLAVTSRQLEGVTELSCEGGAVQQLPMPRSFLPSLAKTSSPFATWLYEYRKSPDRP